MRCLSNISSIKCLLKRGGVDATGFNVDIDGFCLKARRR